MSFYFIMTGVMIVGTAVLAAVGFFGLRLLCVWIPSAWGEALSLHARAKEWSKGGFIAYVAAWILLFPLMLLYCLGRGLWHLGRGSASDGTIYHPHLMPDPKRFSDGERKE